MDISKLKVPDLKRELKNRGLPTTGNKIELVERLQSALKSNDSNTNESVDDFDEDLLNVDDDLDTTEAVINNINEALNSSLPPKKKLKVSENGSNINNTPPKKVILNRNPSTPTEVKISSLDGNKDQQIDEQKKKIKLSDISAKERLDMRAKKFSVELSSEARKIARAERFGLNNTQSVDKGIDNNNVERLKKRAERFGSSVSNVMSKLDFAERLEKRKQRFGVIEVPSKNSNNKINSNDKKQMRFERFKNFLK